MNGEHKRRDYENFDGKYFCDGCGSRGRCSTCERKSVRFPGAVGYCGEADNGVSVRVDTDLGGMAAGEPGFNQVTYAKNIDPADGQWHHIAVTFGLHEETNTQVRIYKDYSLVGENVINGRLKMGSVPTSLNIGRVENANYYYKGLIDEVRISKGVLPVEDMMYADWIGRPFRVIVR